MSIIAKIRQFLRLDKKTLLLDNEFVYSVGLYMNEWKEYEKWDGMESGCFGLHHSSPNSKQDINYSIYHSTDTFHLHQPIHFNHC